VTTTTITTGDTMSTDRMTGERSATVRRVIATMPEPFDVDAVLRAVAIVDAQAVRCVSSVLWRDQSRGLLVRVGTPRAYLYTRAAPPPSLVFVPVLTLEERVAALEATVASLRAALALR